MIDEQAFDKAVNDFIKEQLTVDLPWTMHLRNFLHAYEASRSHGWLDDEALVEVVAKRLARLTADNWGTHGLVDPERMRQEYVSGRWKNYEEEAKAALDAIRLETKDIITMPTVANRSTSEEP